MRRSTAAALTVLTTSSVLALPAGADAATDRTRPQVVSGSISHVVLPIPATGYGLLKVTARATDAVGVAGVYLAIFRKGNLLTDEYGNDAIYPLKRISGTARNGLYRQTIGFDRTDRLGLYSIRVIAVDRADNASPVRVAGRFAARAKTRVLGGNFAPEPVAAGDTLTVRGRAQYVSASGWTAKPGDIVFLEFRPNASAPWRIRKTVRLDEQGRFSTTVRAGRTGQWQVNYSGPDESVPSQSRIDRVVVTAA